MIVSDELVLITAYTPTVERLDNLRELIKQIKKFGYSVCVITHTPTPQDIIDRCDYFIFDSKNDVNRERDICYWTSFTSYIENPYFTIRYKPYNVMSTHIIPIVRLVIGGLSYLKSLNVKKVYMMEYDSKFLKDDILKKMSLDLDDVTISAICTDSLRNENEYVFGPLIGLNLEKINPNLMTTNPNELLELYRRYFNDNIFPITEKILYRTLWSNYSIIWNNLNDFADNIVFDISATDSFYNTKNTYVFHSYKDTLYFFCSNDTEDDWEFNLIINDKNFSIVSSKKSWLWTPIMQTENVETIKIFLNDELKHEMNIPNDDRHDFINRWIMFEPHFE